MNAASQTVTVIGYEEGGDYFNCEIKSHATGAIEKVKIDAAFMSDMCPNTDDLPYDMCGQVFDIQAGEYLPGLHVSEEAPL